MLLIYPFTVRWGLIGASWAVTVVYISSFVLNIFMLGCVLKGFIKIFFRASIIPVAASIGLALVTILMQIELKDMVAFLRFSIIGLAGVIVFSILILILDRSLIFTVIQRGIK